MVKLDKRLLKEVLLLSILMSRSYKHVCGRIVKWLIPYVITAVVAVLVLVEGFVND